MKSTIAHGSRALLQILAFGCVVTATAFAQSSATIRVNAGGPSYVDSAGNTWSADTGFNTGSTTTSTATVTGTTDPQLFKTERYDLPAAPELTYTITIPNGTYFVRLYFAETYTPTKGAGLRVFDVDVQGTRAFNDVDIFTLAGGADKALVLQAPATVTNGQVTIGFLHQVENPKINAIEIIPAGARINVGGPSYVDASGNTWAADYGSNTGSTTTSTATVMGTADPQLFKTERYDLPAAPELQYAVPVPNGTYLVRLFFAETYAATKGVGLRVFDIDVQGSRAFEDVDIFGRAGGGDKALMLETSASVTNGQVAIGFVHQVENPKLNAIEIVPAPITAGAYFTSFEGSTGFSLGALNGQGGWTVVGSANIVNTTASDGVYSVDLPVGGNSIAHSLTSMGAGSITYLDFFIRPTFTGSLDFSSLVNATSAQVGFLQTGSGGRLQVLTSNSQGGVQWLTVGPDIALNSSQQSTTWQRLTLRLNYSTRVWDLYLNDALVAAGLALNSADTFLPSIAIESSTSSNTFFDDIFVGTVNPLPADTAAPAVPTNVTAVSSTSTSVNVFWTAPTSTYGISEYRIYRNATLIGSAQGSKTFFTDTGLVASTGYTYTVQAVNTGGVVSTQSAIISVTTAAGSTPSLEIFSPLK